MVFQITVRSQKVPASVLKATKNSAFYKNTQNTNPTSTPVPAIFRQFLQKKKPLHNKSSPQQKKY
jgi:hypothetical protein